MLGGGSVDCCQLHTNHIISYLGIRRLLVGYLELHVSDRHSHELAHGPHHAQVQSADGERRELGPNAARADLVEQGHDLGG